MGKWCQQRKRGSSAQPALPGPPTPLLSDDDDEVLQTAQGLADTGGLCQIETSENNGLTWADAGSRAWEPEAIWGDVGDFPGQLVRAREVGNQNVYAGPSDWSNILDYR
jgi:hypothetical protein